MRVKKRQEDAPIPPSIWDCSPDMGYWVSRRHEYQVDQGVNIYAEGNEDPIELCFRVAGREAALQQRCAVYLTHSWLPVPAGEPAFVLEDSSRAWKTFGRRPGFSAYWFFGYHHLNGAWRADSAVAHVTDVYSNGILTTVFFEDTGAGDDFNDLVLQIFASRGAATFRAKGQGAPTKKFERVVLPRLQTS